MKGGVWLRLKKKSLKKVKRRKIVFFLYFHWFSYSGSKNLTKDTKLFWIFCSFTWFWIGYGMFNVWNLPCIEMSIEKERERRWWTIDFLLYNL